MDAQFVCRLVYSKVIITHDDMSEEPHFQGKKKYEEMVAQKIRVDDCARLKETMLTAQFMHRILQCSFPDIFHSAHFVFYSPSYFLIAFAWKKQCIKIKHFKNFNNNNKKTGGNKKKKSRIQVFRNAAIKCRQFSTLFRVNLFCSAISWFRCHSFVF